MYIVQSKSNSSRFLVEDEYTMYEGHYDYYMGSCDADEAARFDSIKEAEQAIEWAGENIEDVNILNLTISINKC